MKFYRGEDHGLLSLRYSKSTQEELLTDEDSKNKIGNTFCFGGGAKAGPIHEEKAN